MEIIAVASDGKRYVIVTGKTTMVHGKKEDLAQIFDTETQTFSSPQSAATILTKDPDWSAFTGDPTLLDSFLKEGKHGEF